MGIEKQQLLIIQGSLMGLNEYIKLSRNNKYESAKAKKIQEKTIMLYIKKCELKPITNPVNIEICWYEKHNRRDIDNIIFASKFIMDALVKGGILIDDSRKYIKSINSTVYTDRENPRIEVLIKEITKH